MSQPQLVDVLRLWRLGLPTGMSVHVHEARHDVVPGEVDLTLGLTRTTPIVDRHPGKAHRLDLGNAIALDDDIHGSLRGSAGPVDNRGASQDESAVGAARPHRARSG